jgi:hypothetical protein
VEDIDDAVIVNVVATLAEAAAAGGTGGDFLCDRLAARRTEFHFQKLSRTG